MPTTTPAGHFDQERKYLQSTQEVPPCIPISLPTHLDVSLKTLHTIVPLFLVNQSQKAFSDLTDRFPHTSNCGHKYIFVLYHYNSNTILAKPVKNQQDATLTQAWEKTNTLLKNRDEQPLLYILDNTNFQDFQKAFLKNKAEFQLVPSLIYRRNKAERAIRTFKNHFLAGLPSCNQSFPFAEWNCLIPQMVLALNLLHPLRLNPKLSSYAYLFWNSDFNRCPLAPPGTRIVVHDRPENRLSWGFNGSGG